MTFRLLLIAAHDPRDLQHGMGLLVGNSVRHIEHFAGVESALGVLHAKAPLASHPVPVPNALFESVRPVADRWNIIRSMVPAAATRGEKSFLRLVEKASSDVDAVLWMGYSWDAVTLKLPSVTKRPVFFHCNDSISLYEKRKPNSSGRAARYALAATQEWRLLRSGYHGVIFGSHADAQFAKRWMPRGLRFVSIPNGVDVDVFSPTLGTPVRNDPPVLLFTGVMNYRPNVGAARYLVDEILPRLKTRVLLRLVGKTPGPEVLALGRRPNVVVTGAVDDIVAEYRAADIFVPAIHHATGTKNKVLEALACGLPVVTTSGVVQAFSSPLSGAIVADTADAYAKAVDDLAANPMRRQELAKAAREGVVREFAWESRTRRMVDWIRDSL